MKDWIVVDVEIQKTIEETPGGWDATDKLGVAVACVWEFRGERMRVYGPDDVGALRERLLQADRVSGFNIWKFDYPVIWGIPGRERVQEMLAKTDDILRRIWQCRGLNPDVWSSAHGGWNLDLVAMGTLGVGKIGNGADAPKWYQAGDVQRVVNYCADDVAIERDLAVFIDRYGYIINPKSGAKFNMPRWELGT